MTDLLIRNVPDAVVARLDEQASTKNQSRQAYLLAILEDAAGSDYRPTQWGGGYKAFTKSGGKCSLLRGDGHTMGGASNLTQAEMDAYQKAKMLASPKNGGQWLEARQVLLDAGFEVWNV